MCVTDGPASASPAGLLRVLRDEAGLGLATLAPAGAGESGAAFWVTDHAGTVGLLKIMPGPAEAALAQLRALEAMVNRLRDRGYPAARLTAFGRTAAFGFWIQQRLPGRPLDRSPGFPDLSRLATLLPELIRLNDLQAGLATGAADWPALLVRTLTEGGDGYCLHATLAARPDTRDLLQAVRDIGARCGPAIPPGTDFMHYDFTPTNLLADAATITGVIDINAPVLPGDRAFDLATLLFYVYDHDGIRARLGARLLELAGYQAARAYLAHIVLRQVEWSVRHYPAAAATRRHLRLARQVITDIASTAPPWQGSLCRGWTSDDIRTSWLDQRRQTRAVGGRPGRRICPRNHSSPGPRPVSS